MTMICMDAGNTMGGQRDDKTSGVGVLEQTLTDCFLKFASAPTERR